MSAVTHGAILDDDTFEQTASSVAQVTALNCDGKSRTATGFLFRESDLLVTSLHVVAGCKKIGAYFERNGYETVVAQVTRVHQSADLALLRLERSMGSPLDAAPAPAPQPNDQLQAIGFFAGQPTLHNRSLTVTYGSDRLGDMLPAKQKLDVERNSSLDLNLRILRLDGHLLPGASGAPLVNRSGQVAAVGSGGLNYGAASISWAIPARYLSDLLKSDERHALASHANVLFATTSPESGTHLPIQPRGLQCGGIDFVSLGNRKFWELRMGTDDPRGLDQLMAASGMPRDALDNFEYRIYTPRHEGAAIAIPEWMRVRTRGHYCEARAPDGRLIIEFGGDPVGSPLMAQKASQQFEFAFLQRSGRYWMPDLNYSYLVPLQRFDGLTATRKASFTNDGQGPPAWAFETLMTKRNTFAGVIAVHHNHDPGRVQFCYYWPNQPSCMGIHQEVANFYQTILGVHLSTFPIY